MRPPLFNPNTSETQRPSVTEFSMSFVTFSQRSLPPPRRRFGRRPSRASLMRQRGIDSEPTMGILQGNDYNLKNLQTKLWWNSLWKLSYPICVVNFRGRTMHWTGQSIHQENLKHLPNTICFVSICAKLVFAVLAVLPRLGLFVCWKLWTCNES